MKRSVSGKRGAGSAIQQRTIGSPVLTALCDQIRPVMPGRANFTRSMVSRQRLASAVAVGVAGDWITAEGIEDLAKVAGVHVDVIFGFGDHFVEKDVGENIRD